MDMLLPATQDIAATVVEELALLGGTVSDRFDDGQRLFLRAILPMSDEVRPKDIVEGGIAVRSVGEKIDVCPYLFRQVCRNGAIMPQVIETQCIRRVDIAAPSEMIEAVNDQLREAVRTCATAEVFARAAGQTLSATTMGLPHDVFGLLLALSTRRRISGGLPDEIMRAYLQAGDRSAFGLMNAVTSVARDQKDPAVRWELEEMGGGVPAMSFPRVRSGGSEAELVGAEA